MHLMQCSTAPRFLNYTTDRVRRHQRLKVAEEVSLLRDRTRQTPSLSLPPPEHSTATSRPGFPPNIESNGPRAFDAKPGLSISGFTKALCAMTSVCGNRVARAQGGIAKRILRAKPNRV